MIKYLREKWLDVLSVVILIPVAGILVNGQFAPRQAQAGGVIGRSEQIKDWDNLKDSVQVSVETSGRLQQISAAYGVKNGKKFPLKPLAIEVTTFTDFECPACKHTDSVVSHLADKQGILLRNVIHFPLSNHRNAMNAARAFECADADGQASEMHKVLYQNQDRLGVRSWPSLAAEAQVEDTVAFLRCMQDPATDRRIKAGIALGMRLKVSATPTVVVNGKLIFPPTPEAVDSAITRLIKKS